MPLRGKSEDTTILSMSGLDEVSVKIEEKGDDNDEDEDDDAREEEEEEDEEEEEVEEKGLFPSPLRSATAVL